MHTLKKFSMAITLAALSLAGSAAWATGSFVATAKLNGLNVVPSLLTPFEVTLMLPFRIPLSTTTGETIARLPRNPWRVGGGRSTNAITGDTISNIRLYFGQPFANGQPIATLCDSDIDDNIPELACIESDLENEDRIEIIGRKEFELRDIQFPEGQITADPGVGFTIPGVGNIFEDRRVANNADGLKTLKRLINRGLIYVVINSTFTAKLGPDGIIYTPPAPDPKGGIIDGRARGTLRIK